MWMTSSLNQTGLNHSPSLNDSFDWDLIDSLDPTQLRYSQGVNIMKLIAQQFLRTKSVPLDDHSRILKLFQILQVIVGYLCTQLDKYSNIDSKKQFEHKEQKERTILGIQCPICMKVFEAIHYLDSHLFSRHPQAAATWQSLRSSQYSAFVPPSAQKPDGEEQLKKLLNKFHKTIKQEQKNSDKKIHYWIKKEISTVESKLDQRTTIFADPLASTLPMHAPQMVAIPQRMESNYESDTRRKKKKNKTKKKASSLHSTSNNYINTETSPIPPQQSKFQEAKKQAQIPKQNDLLESSSSSSEVAVRMFSPPDSPDPVKQKSPPQSKPKEVNKKSNQQLKKESSPQPLVIKTKAVKPEQLKKRPHATSNQPPPKKEESPVKQKKQMPESEESEESVKSKPAKQKEIIVKNKVEPSKQKNDSSKPKEEQAKKQEEPIPKMSPVQRPAPLLIPPNPNPTIISRRTVEDRRRSFKVDNNNNKSPSPKPADIGVLVRNDFPRNPQIDETEDEPSFQTISVVRNTMPVKRSPLSPKPVPKTEKKQYNAFADDLSEDEESSEISIPRPVAVRVNTNTRQTQLVSPSSPISITSVTSEPSTPNSPDVKTRKVIQSQPPTSPLSFNNFGSDNDEIDFTSTPTANEKHSRKNKPVFLETETEYDY